MFYGERSEERDTMRTPAGKDCKYYYEDFHRGRSKQECRLVPEAAGSRAWHPSDCNNCPVPDILWANSSEHLHLRADIKPGFMGFGRHVEVTAHCSKHDIVVDDPHVGCHLCVAERSAELSVFFSDDDQEE